MPRTGPRRTAVAVRLLDEQIAQLDGLLVKGQTRSDWLRALIERELKPAARRPRKEKS